MKCTEDFDFEIFFHVIDGMRKSNNFVIYVSDNKDNFGKRLTFVTSSFDYFMDRATKYLREGMEIIDASKQFTQFTLYMYKEK